MDMSLPSSRLALRQGLAIDCAHCAGICCVGLYFAKSEGFPADKPPGKPCRYLAADYRCTVHGTLAKQGLKGCMAFDCLGAGQKVTQVTFGGGSWREGRERAGQMFEAFGVMWQLHRMLWYLLDGAELAGGSRQGQVFTLLEETCALTEKPLGPLLACDLDAHRARVNQLLKQVAGLAGGPGPSYMGKSLRGKNLDGKDLSMALLIAADLEGCSLSGASLLGADLRDANLQGADLSGALFLTQAQVNSARGNGKTKLPPALRRPISWGNN